MVWFRSVLCVSSFVAFGGVFLKRTVSFTLALIFFILFILKHGKFKLFLYIELSNPEETQIHVWEGENESVRSHQHLLLELLLSYKHSGCYGNGSLINVTEKHKILKCFWQCRLPIIQKGCKVVTILLSLVTYK